MKSYDLNKRCSCGRYLKVKAIKSSEFIVNCTDRKCRKENEIKVIMLSDIMEVNNGYE